MFRRKAFTNELTEKLRANPDTSVEDLLSDDLLAQVVRNEADQFLAYLNHSPQNDGRTNLHMLIDMALSGELNTPEMNEKYRIFQLNRNAANIFSGTGQAIPRAVTKDEYAIQKLKSFWLPENEKYNRDPGFAGHFQRIFTCWAEKNTDWLEGFDMPKFVSFLCENIDVLAYQRLLVTLGTDFPQLLTGFGDNPEVAFITCVLKEAARHVFNISKDGASDENWLYRNRERAVHNREDHPITREGKRVPIPQRPDPAIYKEGGIRRERLEEMQKRCGYVEPTQVDIDEEKMKAYLLLNVVRLMSDDGAELDLFFNEDSEEAFEYLFCCGVYADDFSIVSPTAFKVLEMLAFGIDNDEFSIPPVKTKIWKGIAEKFADELNFSDVVTPKLIAAFPFFANHRYERLAVFDQKYQYAPLTVRERAANFSENTYTVERLGGKSPLEVYVRLLPEEPQLSDKLNASILNAWDSLVNAAKDVKAKNTQGDSNAQATIREAEMPLVMVLQSQFDYGGEPAVDIMQVIFGGKHVPVPQVTLQEKRNEERKEKGDVDITDLRCRVPCNGFLLEFARKYINAKVGSLPNGKQRLNLKKSRVSPDPDIDRGLARYVRIIKFLDNFDAAARVIEHETRVDHKTTETVMEQLAERENLHPQDL